MIRQRRLTSKMFRIDSGVALNVDAGFGRCRTSCAWRTSVAHYDVGVAHAASHARSVPHVPKIPSRAVLSDGLSRRPLSG
ncbi:unnamed protein product [Leptosia nina]|uniref:Uncharacterized protein n=1 Tax=Leptosia nina TaxID=320188 RepID=A0AAV1JJM3_9NEOP